MSNSDTFDETVSGGLWSNPANWSSGVPTDGSSVVDADSTTSVDDLSSLSLASLALSNDATVEVTEGTLTIGTLSGISSPEFLADGGYSEATTVPVTVTVGTITGAGGTYGADGAKSVFIDNSATDTGNNYYAIGGGKLELAAAPAASSTLAFDATYESTGTIALENPGSVTSAAIRNLSSGDVLELPGSSVTSVVFGSNTLDVTTNTGEFVFSNVTYDTADPITGYTSSVDPRTGLEAITFTTPDVFIQGSLWSTAADWSEGAPPVDGSSVATGKTSSDDLSNLTLASLIDTSGGFTYVTDGTLSVGTVSGVSGGQLEAFGGLNAATTVPVTVTVGTLTEADSAFGAEGAKSLFVDNSASDPGETIFFADAGGTVEIANRVAASSTLYFDPASNGHGTIALENPGELISAQLEDVSAGDVLELPGSSVTSVVFGSTTLEVITNTGDFVFSNVTYNQSDLVDGYTSSFDSSTQLEAITFVACFLAGTSILTDRGEVAVERLSIGDVLITASGQQRPVRWLGSRRLDCTRYQDPTVIWPICIKEGAFAPAQPSRDLWVSPGHSILVDGALIQASNLVNGATIVQVPRSRVEYWHVELDSHDCIVAEGLASESYLDTGNRTAFVNGGAFLEAYPDFQPRHWSETCVPLVLDGPQLVQAKASLIDRAHQMGYRITGDSDPHMMADGRRVEAIRISDRRLAFVVPSESQQIEIHCRTFIPRHVDPASNDGRALGLCIGRLQIDGSDVPLDSGPMFDAGWHEFECHADGRTQRWSTERITLPPETQLVLLEFAGSSYCWESPAHTTGSRPVCALM